MNRYLKQSDEAKNKLISAPNTKADMGQETPRDNCSAVETGLKKGWFLLEISPSGRVEGISLRA